MGRNLKESYFCMLWLLLFFVIYFIEKYNYFHWVLDRRVFILSFILGISRSRIECYLVCTHESLAWPLWKLHGLCCSCFRRVKNLVLYLSCADNSRCQFWGVVYRLVYGLFWPPYLFWSDQYGAVAIYLSIGDLRMKNISIPFNDDSSIYFLPVSLRVIAGDINGAI